jgi:hypothetical protein
MGAGAVGSGADTGATCAGFGIDVRVREGRAAAWIDMLVSAGAEMPAKDIGRGNGPGVGVRAGAAVGTGVLSCAGRELKERANVVVDPRTLARLKGVSSSSSE